MWCYNRFYSHKLFTDTKDSIPIEKRLPLSFQEAFKLRRVPTSVDDTSDFFERIHPCLP